MIRIDNGPEFMSHKVGHWCKERNITIAFIQHGKPTQNACVKRFNGNLRRESLNACVIKTLSEVRQKVEELANDNNKIRPWLNV